MYNVLAVDPGLRNIGIAYCINGKTFTERWQFTSKYSKNQILQSIYERITYAYFQRRKWDQILFAVFEQYAFRYISKATTRDAEAMGILKGALMCKGIPVIELSPNQWKRLAMGSDFVTQSKAKRYQAEYLAKIDVRYQRLFDNTDEADAFLMLRAVDNLRVVSQINDMKDRDFSLSIGNKLTKKDKELWEEIQTAIESTNQMSLCKYKE